MQGEGISTPLAATKVDGIIGVNRAPLPQGGACTGHCSSPPGTAWALPRAQLR